MARYERSLDRVNQLGGGTNHIQIWSSVYDDKHNLPVSLRTAAKIASICCISEEAV
jgi:hypothetical protein